MMEETTLPRRGWSWRGYTAVGLLVLVVFYTAVRYNQMANLEVDIPQLQTKSKNSLSTLVNSAKSQGMVTAQYEDAFMRALDKSVKGRYGEGGVKALVLAMKEENIPLSPEMYQRIQVVLEGGYRKFEADQNAVLDACRTLRKLTDYGISSVVAKVFGFPHIKLAEYENIVLNQDAATAFETKRMGPIDVRPEK